MLSQFSLIFCETQNKMSCFIVLLKTSCADYGGLCDHLRDVPWEDIFNLSATDADSEFCEWVEVGIDVYIPHCN